jgi:hypothetical protein
VEAYLLRFAVLAILDVEKIHVGLDILESIRMALAASDPSSAVLSNE